MAKKESAKKKKEREVILRLEQFNEQLKNDTKPDNNKVSQRKN
jgi:hypothetical protein